MSLMAFGVGALHALDADHVMAVSSLAVRRPAPRECLTISVRWAIGHGATLMLIAAAFFILGHALPTNLGLHAERSVALLLVIIGLSVLFDLATKGARLRLHRHPGMRPHVHWIQPHNGHETGNNEAHGAVLVGALHGLAGSAPLMAMVPVGSRGSFGDGVLILLAFSVGVLMMMLLFGAAFGVVLERSRRGLVWLRAFAGSASMLVGGVIFSGTF